MGWSTTPGGRIWVTRTAPGATTTGADLRNLGYEPVVAPLLDVRPIPARFDLAGVGALVFTSPNGVRAFARHGRERRLPVFAVGDGTASAARRAGFDRIHSAKGDLRDLVTLIVRRWRDAQGTLLRVGSRQASGDIVGALRAHGLVCRNVPVYETVAALLEPELDRIIGAAHRPLRAVLLYSLRGARQLSTLFATRPPPARTAVCLSPAVAATLGPLRFRTLHCASRPTAADLLKTLERLTMPQGD